MFVHHIARSYPLLLKMLVSMLLLLAFAASLPAVHPLQPVQAYQQQKAFRLSRTYWSKSVIYYSYLDRDRYPSSFLQQGDFDRWSAPAERAIQAWNDLGMYQFRQVYRQPADGRFSFVENDPHLNNLASHSDITIAYFNDSWSPPHMPKPRNNYVGHSAVYPVLTAKTEAQGWIPADDGIIYLTITRINTYTDSELQYTAGHELGHILGLDHRPWWQGICLGRSIMETPQQADSPIEPQRDDVNGLRKIWGHYQSINRNR